MNHRFEDIIVEKMKNRESIRGNLRYGQAIKLSAASIILRENHG